MPRLPQSRRPHPETHTDADTAHTLANEQLLEATEIVRELLPGAEHVVLTDPDEPHEPGALQLLHVLDAHGAVLYTAGQHDALADLIETHLIDARDASPDTRPAHIRSTEFTTAFSASNSAWVVLARRRAEHDLRAQPVRTAPRHQPPPYSA